MGETKIGYDESGEYEYLNIKDYKKCSRCRCFFDNEKETRFECHKLNRSDECYENKYED